jgi:hypothetical protein
MINAEQIQWIQKALEDDFDAAMAWCDSDKAAREIIKESERKMDHAEKVFAIKIDRSFLDEWKKMYKYKNTK